MKSDFREWTLDTIDEAFGLDQVRTLPILDELLAFPCVVDCLQNLQLCPKI